MTRMTRMTSIMYYWQIKIKPNTTSWPAPCDIIGFNSYKIRLVCSKCYRKEITSKVSDWFYDPSYLWDIIMFLKWMPILTWLKGIQLKLAFLTVSSHWNSTLFAMFLNIIILVNTARPRFALSNYHNQWNENWKDSQ